MPPSRRASRRRSLHPWRLVVGAALIAALATCATHANADHTPSRKTCILFEDDSFMCGTVDPLGEWLDRSQPYVVGCIPMGLCADDSTTSE